MKKYLFLSCLLFALAGVLSLVSCDDDDDEMKSSSGTHTKAENEIIRQLVGTSWMTKSITFYDYNNKEVSSFDKTKYPDYITFTDKKYPYFSDHSMILYVDHYSKDKYGYNGYTYVSHWTVSGNEIEGDPGAGNCFGEIVNISKNEIKTKYIGNWDNEWYRIDVYSPAEEPTHNFKPTDDDDNSGGGSGSGGSTGGSSYEKPEIGFDQYDSTNKSLKVQYRIYNKDEAKVTSAKIYYGTSSNPKTSKTATVSGVLIYANITGLKAGTSYYVKCVATGRGGTTTTSVTRCMTDY